MTVDHFRIEELFIEDIPCLLNGNGLLTHIKAIQADRVNRL